MRAQRKNTFPFFPLLFLTFGFLGRKVGFSFGSGLIILCGIWLVLSCLISGIKRIKHEKGTIKSRLIPEELLLGLCFSFTLFQQQYWIYSPWLSIVAFTLFIFGYLGAFFQKQRLISAFNLTKAAWPDWIRIYFISFLLFLVITGLFLNARQFHNFYRMSTYEEYLRGRYPKLSLEEADALLSKYHEVSDRSSKKAQDLFEKALQYEKEKNYVLALRYFNLSIDQDPLNPEVYFQRGRMKINRLELNKDLAYSSIIDFTESIRLRPDHGASYFNRGIIFSYLDKKEQACADMTEAFRINPKFDVMPFVKKCCPKDSASFVPLHP